MLLLAAALPWLLSQCSKKPPGATPALTSGDAGKIAGDKLPTPNPEPFAPSSRRLLDRSLNLPPDRLEALGDMALANQDYETSLINFLRILQEDPQRYDLRYKVGVIFLINGQLEAARQELAFVLVKHPEMLQAHEALGLVHLQEKQYPLAIEEFQLALAQDANRPKTQYLLGIAYLESGKMDRAVLELKRAAALAPSSLAPLLAIGQAAYQMKDYTQAIAWLNRARAAAPQDQRVYYYLGMSLAALKRYDEALAAFVKAGDEAQAYNNIAVHYLGEGRYEEAAKCFQRALDLRPVLYQEARNNLQRALEKLRETRKNDG